MSAFSIPFLTIYDPPGSSEGTLDPLGLYQIADQLATRLVPAVRERMQRIRFLTAMSVGALVTEGLSVNPDQPDVPPFLAWEWLVVEAMLRTRDGEKSLWGVPGTQVTKRALAQHGYLDGRSYLKTPRIFGFHGVYKRLAIHLGLLDSHLDAGQECERLVDAWAKGLGYGGLSQARPLLDGWRRVVERSMAQDPARTRTGWSQDDWRTLAEAFLPGGARSREKRHLRELLHSADERELGALPHIWRLQEEFADDAYFEESTHIRLKRELPAYAALLDAIRVYERFCRSLQDAFDIMRAEAAIADAHGLDVHQVANIHDFRASLIDLERKYEEACHHLGGVDLQIRNLFDERFSRFAEPMDVAQCAMAICEHHEVIQRAKSNSGKRAWFDRLGPSRIYMRHSYRIERPTPQPTRFVHDYRGWPIRRFWRDLQ